MNCIHWLFLTLSVAYAHTSEEDDQHRNNSSVHLDCFNVFIPLINRLSNEAKEASINCVNSATVEKDRELKAIKTIRSELFSEVKKIRETLAHCSARSDHQGYFECLNGIIEIDKKIVGDITLKSSLYSNKLQKIEEQELNCFRNSVVKVKDKISNGINNLQYCLMSEDAPTPITSGERLDHKLKQIGDGTDALGSVLPPNIHQTTPSYPEDYDDYNNY